MLTYDVDFWVRDSAENLDRLNIVLRELKAEWGPHESTWRPVPADSGWLRTQGVFCLTSAHGAIDIFREVIGLEGAYDTCRARSQERETSSGIRYASLSDIDMLACQMALPESERRHDRVAYLQNLIGDIV